MKRVLNGFVCLFVIVIACVLFYGISQGYFEKIDKKDIITSNIQLTERVKEELLDGTEEFTIYTQNLELMDLKNVNSSLDGFYGFVDSYATGRKIHDDMVKTTLKLSISDNYYVYQNYVNGLNIDEHKTAKELAVKAGKILKKVIKKGMTDYEKELAIHNYIVKHASYGYVNGKEDEKSYRAYGVLIKNKGVCNSYAEAMQLLLTMAGVESQMIVGTADKVDHAWNLVKLDGHWYHVDATWNDPVPDVKGRVLMTYFNVTDKMIASNHKWIKENYPKANKRTYNYYQMEKRYCKDYASFQTIVTELLKQRHKEIDVLAADYDEQRYNYQFVLQIPGVSRIQWNSFGDVPCTTVVIKASYE